MSSTSKQLVISVDSKKSIGPVAAIYVVVSAVDRSVPIAAGYHIVASVTVELIVTCEAVDMILAIASVDFIIACLPAEEGSLLGDKAVSSVFDNSKLKKFVPDFQPRVTYAEGIKKTIAWFDADPARRKIDETANRDWDKIIAAYEHGLTAARVAFPA